MPPELSLPSDDPCDSDDGTANLLGEHQFKGHSICVTRGDYAPLMKRVAESLTKAKVSMACGMCLYVCEFTNLYFIRNTGMIVKQPCWMAMSSLLLLALWKTTNVALVTGSATKVLLWRRESFYTWCPV